MNYIQLRMVLLYSIISHHEFKQYDKIYSVSIPLLINMLHLFNVQTSGQNAVLLYHGLKYAIVIGPTRVT